VADAPLRASPRPDLDGIREPRLQARWSKREDDIQYKWDAGVPKSDAHLLHSYLCYSPDFGNVAIGQSDPRYRRSLLDELKARGYDLTTLRFSVALSRRAAHPEETPSHE
jgi:hypothetical protein